MRVKKKWVTNVYNLINDNFKRVKWVCDFKEVFDYFIKGYQNFSNKGDMVYYDNK